MMRISLRGGRYIITIAIYSISQTSNIRDEHNVYMYIYYGIYIRMVSCQPTVRLYAVDIYI
jgi:hypothetical protein